MQTPVIIREIDCPPREELANWVRRLAATCEVAWLDSAGAPGRSAAARHGSARGRFSVVGHSPVALIEQVDGREAEFRIGERILDLDASGWRLWERGQRRISAILRGQATGCGIPSGDCPCDGTARGEIPYSPGWMGVLGYEMAGQLECLPAHRPIDTGLPLMRVALFDRLIVVDHVERRAFAMQSPSVRSALGLPADRAEVDWCGAGAPASGAGDPPIDASPGRAGAGTTHGVARETYVPPSAHFETTQSEHESAVRRALDYIAAGDVYQVNLAHRVRFDGPGDAFAMHERIRRDNPAEYAAMLRWTDDGEPRAVISASPELFLDVRDGRVRTRPIKGTRPWLGDEVLDAIRRRELLESAKEEAELAMIVDLHRNDLGRVCEFGTIRVEAAREIEQHPTVFHTVAEIRGRLAAGRDAFDLLRAAFPAGSVTGAPKIRAMQIIRELEPSPRGAYTGAVGWLGLSGDMTWNVAIRTVQQSGSRAWLHVGGGIVADSEPAAEYEETLAKGRGILAAMGCAERVAASEVSGAASLRTEPDALSAKAPPFRLPPRSPSWSGF